MLAIEFSGMVNGPYIGGRGTGASYTGGLLRTFIVIVYGVDA
jgi:hypothetical protein